MFEKLAFRFPFRKYQRMILDQVVPNQTDRKYHIVAPPGAGKTIIGLELVRQFDAPAVIFAPTTTIQAQWRQKLEMFVESPDELGEFASMDPRQAAPIRILTYQVISTPAEAQKYLHEAALVLWKDELMQEGQATDTEAAQVRLATLENNNPDAYHRELLHYANRVKHKLLHEPGADVEHFLHPNARQLIDDLVSYGVKTVVLDECHHLLDYWAIVLRYLVDRIDAPRVVGLTATLPSPEDDAEFENYNGLLGEVDFEIPTPAVVKEGDLAPYQDLAYLVKPTTRELEYLERIQAEFETAISGLTGDVRFVEWVKSLVAIPAETSSPQKVWQAAWDEHPLQTLAAVRFLSAAGFPPDPKLVTPVEAHDPMQLEDWSLLLERFGLDVLKTSPDPADHTRFQSLRKAIQPYGLTLTERGMSQGRSPGDLVMTFSEAKDFAVVHILKVESQAMGERLRAVVVTDFEQLGTGIRQLKGVLDSDAGSAIRLFRLLATRPEVAGLCPALVTGKRLMLSARDGERLHKRFAAYLKEQSLDAVCSLKPAGAGMVEVTGEGRDWAPRTYVRMATEAFEAGEIKCLVGTRGIFGEGWDSLTLNTLIDLTSVTTRTSVQQLRGRTIRLDPNWPHKLAHNWDVVCIAPKFKRGNIDFIRFINRHLTFWSLVTYVDWLDRRETSGDNPVAPPYMHGKIAKGIIHVSPELAHSLLQAGDDFWKTIEIGKHNRRTMKQVTRRDQTYDLWGVGEEYSNFAFSTTSLDPRDLKIKTAFTMQNSLKSLIRDLFASILAAAFQLLYMFRGLLLNSLRAGQETRLLCIVFVLWFIAVLTLVINGKKIYRAFRSLFIEQVPEIGRAHV
jgi:superfamily II DNA or RNA helicase